MHREPASRVRRRRRALTLHELVLLAAAHVRPCPLRLQLRQVKLVLGALHCADAVLSVGILIPRGSLLIWDVVVVIVHAKHLSLPPLARAAALHLLLIVVPISTACPRR